LRYTITQNKASGTSNTKAYRRVAQLKSRTQRRAHRLGLALRFDHLMRQIGAQRQLLLKRQGAIARGDGQRAVFVVCT